MSGMKGSKIKEHVCPACNGTGYPVVKQPVQPGRRVYPVKCTSCDGKGKVTEAGPSGTRETRWRWLTMFTGKIKPPNRTLVPAYHRRGRLKPENRCLVPFNSFAEYAP